MGTPPPTPSWPAHRDHPLTARGRRTRTSLLAAGREVFEARGFADVTVDDVAHAAGVSHGTFYRYFDSLETLLREVVISVMGDVFTAIYLEVDAHDRPYAKLEAANRRHLQALTRNAAILRVLDSVAAGRPEFAALQRQLRGMVASRVAEVLSQLQEQGEADPTLSPLLTATALVAMIEHFAVAAVAQGELGEFTAVDTVTRLWAQGIGLEVPEFRQGYLAPIYAALQERRRQPDGEPELAERPAP